MYEELYVITSEGRFRLDLCSPSGITLNFKSNIFGDLSKINSSHSYTFKLPLTSNNRRVLDMADDVRHDSCMARRRLRAEFRQNGVPLFTNCYLYIDTVEGAFNAVMTWSVLDGFQLLKDEDCPINQLPSDGLLTTFGPDNGAAIAGLDNEAAVLKPIYSCGLVYRNMINFIYANQRGRPSGGNPTYGGYTAYPLPVVPVRRLLQLINERFGCDISLGHKVGYADVTANTYSNEFDVVDRGVIPLVGKTLTYEQEQERAFTFTPRFVDATADNIKNAYYLTEMQEKVGSIMVFDSPSIPDVCPFSISNANINGSAINCSMYSSINRLNFIAYGIVELTIDGYDGSEDAEAPTLTIYQPITEYSSTTNGTGGGSRKKTSKLKELASVTGEQQSKVSNTRYVYTFDFRKDQGNELNATEVWKDSVLFCVNYRVVAKSTFGSGEIQIVPDYSDTIDIHEMDIMSNLPDISCLNFVKALFYMMGAFPSVNGEGKIEPVFYRNIKDNISIARDWSSKIMSPSGVGPDKLTYSVGGMGQRNYYLMKSDNLQETEADRRDKTDIFASGIGVINVANEVLEKNKTIIQLPFNAPYTLNKKTPQYYTGDTFKVWEYKNKEFSFNNPGPILGLISKSQIVTHTVDTTGVTAGSTYEDVYVMHCWNGFADMATNPSYAYLQKLMDTPYVVTEKLNLNEFDLMEIDYSIPIYLEKYSAYFAIVSITRDSKGVCKCELLKLPQ